MSEGLSIHEPNRQIKTVIDECINEALENLKKSEEPNLSENELIKRGNELRDFVKEYCERKLSDI